MQIEKGVPLPEFIAGHPRKYPFPDMEVGDSFTVPLTGEQGICGSDIAAEKVRKAACNFGRRHKWKFTIRTMRAEGVVRCWRVS